MPSSPPVNDGRNRGLYADMLYMTVDITGIMRVPRQNGASQAYSKDTPFWMETLDI